MNKLDAKFVGNVFRDFIDYVFESYEGKYAKPQIIKATVKYLKSVNNTNFTWGSGDSIDRERVYDILESEK